jgi:glycosyltransferase involved in cell wall biosynthesis
MKKVLAVTFDFPPRRTSGVYRATGMAKYLPNFGWSPNVLTVEKLDNEIEDPLLLMRVPEAAEVTRTRYFNVAGWETSASRAIQSLGGLQSRSADSAEPRKDRKIRSMGALLRSILYFPDDTVGWVPFGLEGAIALHLQKRFDVIYTTSPPRSAPVIGLFFKWLLGLPWVAEFRDPWIPPAFPFRRKAERFLLGIMLRAADRVVVHSKGFCEDLQQQFSLPAEKFALVSNGYDEPDFAVDPSKDEVPFPPGFVHVSHFGTIYPNRSGKFFQAVKELVQESPEIAKKLRINVVGFSDDESQRYASTIELKEVIQFFPFMQHDLTVQAMRASHGLLIFWGDPAFSRLTVAGKLYEYMRSGRPILALDHAGETTELIEAAQAGWAVHPDDTEAIKGVLRKLVANAQNNPSVAPARPDFVSQFRYDRLAARLAKVFDEVTANGR